MGNCENSNEKLMFFDIAHTRSEIKTCVLLEEID